MECCADFRAIAGRDAGSRLAGERRAGSHSGPGSIADIYPQDYCIGSGAGGVRTMDAQAPDRFFGHPDQQYPYLFLI